MNRAFTKTRWAILLLLCLAIAGGLYYVDGQKDELERLKGQLAQKRSELQQVRRLERELQQQAKLITEWNTLWADVEQAGLAPDRHWFVNPINTRATAEWPDIADLVAYVSYGDDQTTGYWFAPEFLHVNRVLQGLEGPAEEDNATAAGARDRDTEDTAAEGPATFQIHLKGQFLVPRD